jgi:hypothetical protein
MIKLAWSFWLTLLILSPASAQALSSTDSASPQTIRERVRQQIQTDVQPTRQAVKEQVQERVQARAEAVCENVTARIENRINQYEQNRDKWMTHHQGVVKRLNSLADKLESRSCDVTIIRNDIQKYQLLVSDFAAAFRLFHDSLNDSRQYACGESQGQFADKLKQARTEVQAVRTSGAALKDFFNATLKLHLRQVGQTCTNQTED